MAVKIAVSKGAEVYAFTTSADKVEDIKGFGVKEVIVVDEPNSLYAHAQTLDYMICSIPYQFEVFLQLLSIKWKLETREI